MRLRHATTTAVLPAAIMLLFAACEGTSGLAGGGGEDGGSSAEAGGDGAAGPRLELRPAVTTLRVNPGKSGKLRVDITRHGLEPTLVTLTAKNLPKDVSSPTIIVPADASFGELTFTAPPEAARTKQTIEIAAIAGAVNAQASIELTVAPPPGSLDNTFGPGGSGIVETTNLVGALSGVAVQTDGKVVIVGAASGGPGGVQWSIARLLLDGAPDSSFGTETGRATMSVTGCNEGQASAVAIDSAGGIIVGGYGRCPELDYVVAKFTPDGGKLAETTFGTGGQTRVLFPGDESPSSIALQPGGEMLLAGTAAISSGNSGFGIVRLTTSGAHDTAFGGTGRVTYDPTVDYDYITSIGVQPSAAATNKIVVVGRQGGTAPKDSIVARFTSAGIDSSFGTAGLTSVDFSPLTSDAWSDLLVEPDGKILVVGSSQTTTVPMASDITLARFLPEGGLDTTFGTAGKTLTTIPMRYATANAVVRAPDGSFVLCGAANDRTMNEAAFVAARYLPNGQLDPSFGTQGMTITVVGTGSAYPTGAAMAADGSIVCAGLTSNNPPAAANVRTFVIRYTP